MAHPIVHHTKRVLSMPHLVIPITAIVAVAIGAGVYFFSGTGKYYETTPVTYGTVNSALSTSGTVKAATQTNLAFPKGGRVASVSIKAGAIVWRGQTLAGLDSNDAKGAVTAALGAYQSAEANYARLKNGASNSDIGIAKIAYDSAVSETSIAVTNAYEKLLSSDLTPTSSASFGSSAPLISGTYTGTAEGTLILDVNGTSSGNFWSTTGLIKATGQISSQVPQPIGTSGLYVLFPSVNIPVSTTWTIAIPNTSGPNYTANNAAYQSALQNQTSKVAQAKAALDKVQALPRDEDIAQAEAQVKSAEGALETAKAAYANDFITAPIDGVITSVDSSLTPGSIVTSNTPLIGIMSKGAFQIESYVSEKDLSLVNTGEEVAIVTDAYGPSVVFKGTIIALNPAATTQPNGQLGYKVTYQFSDSDPRIKPGLSANVTMSGATKTNVLAVPRSAVFLKNGTSFVLVKNGTKTEERSVTTGSIGTDTTEILSGLKEGELVVTLGIK